jgi:hypothetical protein
MASNAAASTSLGRCQSSVTVATPVEPTATGSGAPTVFRRLPGRPDGRDGQTGDRGDVPAAETLRGRLGQQYRPSPDRFSACCPSGVKTATT